MKTSTILFSVLLLLPFSGCNLQDSIPVIGFNEKGEPAQILILEKEYTKRFTALTQSVQDSAVPVLDKHESRSAWMLRTLSFGIGMNAEIGIGPFKVGAFPRMRLIFTNSSEPTLP